MPGKIEKVIKGHLAAHPDEAFTTEHLAAVCYPHAPTVERKHRVVVARAVDKVIADDPDWRSDRSVRRGRTVIIYNAASVMSRAMARCLEAWIFQTREDLLRAARRWLGPGWNNDNRAEITEQVAEHIAIRNGNIEEAERIREKLDLRLTVRIGLRMQGLLPTPSPPSPADLAKKARALMTENDPDAIRAGLVELAEALDELA